MSLRSEILSVRFPHDAAGLRRLTAWIDEHAQQTRRTVLRWGLIARRGDEGLLELASAAADQVPALHWSHRPAPPLPGHPGSSRCVALVVPTGVGAAIGGFIGDASPVARVLETLSDAVLVHPNVVNASAIYGGGPKSLYVDGLTLDRFFRGELWLARPQRIRIGVVIDRLGEEETDLALAAVEAARAVRGADIAAIAIASEKLASRVQRSEHEHYLGQMDNPQVLLQAVEQLRRQGATAIAIVSEIGGIDNAAVLAHYHGHGPNPFGAMEALLSRTVTATTGLPCAHAPVLPRGAPTWLHEADPRAAAELVSRSGFPCVLQGLASCAEGIAPGEAARAGSGALSLADLGAIILPYDCAGGPPAVYGAATGTRVIAVRENHCQVGVSADELELATLLPAASYAEAIGMLACERAGVSPGAIRRPLPRIPIGEGH